MKYTELTETCYRITCNINVFKILLAFVGTNCIAGGKEAEGV